MSTSPFPLGRVGAALWDLKTRLQFTGWLQFIPSGLLAALWLLAAGAGYLIGALPALLFWTPLTISSVLWLVWAFDLVTLKFGVRPYESIPAPLELDAFDLMRARRSCRSFQSRPLTDAHRARITGLARDAAAPDRLLGNNPIRFEYIAAPLTVWPVLGAKEFLVAIAPKEYSRQAVIDVGRSLQGVVIEATRLGVATCWIGPGADHASILAHLGDRLDAGRDHIICVCALGYRSRLIPLTLRLILKVQRRRLPLSELFFRGGAFQTPLDTDAEPFRRFGRCYEVCQWSPSSFNGQPTRATAVMESREGPPTVARFDFAASTKSRFYSPVALGIWLANWEMGCEALGLDGRFAVLGPEERGAGGPELPRYDVSWVVG